MTDQQERQTAFFLEVTHQIENLGLHRNIQGGRGFIGDEQIRPARQRAGDAHSLTLPTTEAGGARVQGSFWQADLFQEATRGPDGSAAAPAIPPMVGVSYHLLGSELGIERPVWVLKDHLNPSADRVFGRPLAPLLATDAYCT
ncbi:hypothetical protein EB74_13730 [Mycobacterium sp. SWH-M5]|nr:hypothetical protein EB74_13730 [Mycobacterium sp. SWH-M5]